MTFQIFAFQAFHKQKRFGDTHVQNLAIINTISAQTTGTNNPTTAAITAGHEIHLRCVARGADQFDQTSMHAQQLLPLHALWQVGAMNATNRKFGGKCGFEVRSDAAVEIEICSNACCRNEAPAGPTYLAWLLCSESKKIVSERLDNV